MMKKLGLIMYMICNWVAFGREGIDYHDFPEYIGMWNRHLDWSNDFFIPEGAHFTTDPFKQKLRDEIGADPIAIRAFELFHQHKFTDVVDCWETYTDSMTKLNSSKFFYILMSLAPILNLTTDNSHYVEKIVQIAGGAKNIYNYLLHGPDFLQFCFEMFFCVMVDSDEGAGETSDYQLSRASESICEWFAEGSQGAISADEINLMDIVGIREAEGGYGCISDFKREWCSNEDNQ
jgi:hypothetical protein